MSGQLQLSEMTIEEVLGRWPETAVIFHEYAMACVGCAVAPFCTVKDAAHDYDVPVATLMQRLRQVIPSHEVVAQRDDEV